MRALLADMYVRSLLPVSNYGSPVVNCSERSPNSVPIRHRVGDGSKAIIVSHGALWNNIFSIFRNIVHQFTKIQWWHLLGGPK